ncbi:putative ABC transport system permease protein [Sphingomonas sp. NFR04]|uniref:FtsX-like permease family protein n=1 Tax=Sphingomonas sp. NFR04 TaxID=1566283 RepID=UPI0008F2ACE8|nr:FtsX-like permease family protein [Sphingomonas sp. NFR04]SFJ07610.1 putative ABC transport system permease protein [Sphingomonas sp. NFR04]
MHRLAWLALYRSFTRHKLFTLVNIGGLALGIAVFLILYLFVRYETSFDHEVPGWDRTWIVERKLQFPGANQVNIPSRREMLAQLQAEHAGLQGARLLPGDAALQLGTGSTQTTVGQVDANFFRLFPFPVVAGDPTATLATPDGAVITERLAQTYLPGGSAVGRMLKLTLGGKPRLVRVGAVVRLSKAMTQPGDIFLRLPADADLFAKGSQGLQTLLRIDPAEAGALQQRVAGFDQRHPDPSFASAPKGIRVETGLIPLGALHLRAARDRIVVATLGLVGLLALLVAIGNYVNLTTARAGLRAREVAMRKTLGATRGALIGQFLAESIATTALAALLGLAVVEVALPMVNAIGGTDLHLRYWGSGTILPALLALILGVGLIAGAYPAFVLSRFRPAAVLASAGATGGGRSGRVLRATLVVLQFAIAIVLMIGTGVLLAQVHHTQTADLGFQRHGLAMLSSFGDPGLDAAQRHDIAAAVAALPGVTGTAQSAIAPGGGSYGIMEAQREGIGGDKVSVIQAAVGPGFFQLYGAHLLAGRWFDPRGFASDDAAGGKVHAVLLNRTAIVRLGFASPAAAIGKAVVGGQERQTIIGVIDDLRLMGPIQPVEAQAYALQTSGLPAPVLSLRYTGDDTRALLDRVETVWRRHASAVPLKVQTVDQQLYETYIRADLERARLFTAGAALAVLIGCIGLYGLAAFDTERRIKEIGIRKALGASTRDVLQLLVARFLRPVLIANLIAWPLAWVAMQRWLAGFDDRIALTPWYFLGASALAVAIAVLTVLGQSWRVARAEPARALRYE